MKLITMVMISLSLSSCLIFDPEITALAEEICIKNGGLSSGYIHLFSDLNIRCNDGARFEFEDQDEAEEFLEKREKQEYEGEFIDPRSIP